MRALTGEQLLPTSRLKAPSAFKQAEADSLDFSYRMWRERFLQILLTGSTIAGFIALVFSVIHQLRMDRPLLAAIYCAAWGILLVTTVSHLPYRVRSGVFLALIYALGLSGLLENGLHGDARLVFLAFSLLTAFLARPWAGILALGTSLLGIVLVGVAGLAGILSPINAAQQAPGLWDWTAGSIGFLIIGAACLTAVTLLGEAFDAAQERLQKTLGNLRESHASMEETTERLRRMAYFDPSTGLPNGLQLETDMNAILEGHVDISSRRLVMAGFRLTGLKRLNEKQGMETTSRAITEILKTFGGFLQGWLSDNPGARPPAPIRDMYRAEANTFVFLFSDGAVGEATAPFEEGLFRAALRDALNRHDMVGRLDFQGGYTVHPDDAPSLPQLLRNLLNVLHTDPDVGAGRFTAFNPAKYGEYLRQEQIRQSMKLAMEKGEFYMVFQPKLMVSTGTVGGFEALARWESPTLGRVSPVEFIPLAEQQGEIEALTLRLCKDAWRFIHALRDIDDRDVRVSVNLSPQLLNTPFLERLIEEVAIQGVGPYLEFEITESSLMRLSSDIEALFDKLRELGVGFSIDDFGTGYSNLGYLQNFQPDVLKIDKSFIDGIPMNEKSGTLVKAIVHMARSFDMSVVAEGVEYQVQKDFLVSNDCDVIQGYLCSKPLAFDDALAFYQQ